MSISRKITEGAGSGSGGGSVGYVDDVFSTYLYTGDGAQFRTIENGIDLDGEGGLVWIKNRDTSSSHYLQDTERGPTQTLSSNTADASLASELLSSFNSNGFTTSQYPAANASGNDMVAWTWRKSPRFLDVVTWTGDGVAGREIPHNLGVEPGMVIVKCTSELKSWAVYHRSQGGTKYGVLNTSAAFAGPYAPMWNNTDPTSTVITLGTDSSVNGVGGQEYVAYVFAHDDSDEGMIQCGSFSPSPSGFTDVDLGWEPQWILTKATVSSGVWRIMDNMRGVTEDDASMLYPNSANAEDQGETASRVKFTATGFAHNCNFEGIYVAIRRPNKPAEEFEPEELFAIDKPTSSRVLPAWISGFPVDFALWSASLGTEWVSTRLTSGKILKTSSSEAEVADSKSQFDFPDGHGDDTTSSSMSWMWRRAPGFMDVVTYTGNGVEGRTVAHNLGAVPEMMWVKNRNRNGYGWAVYSASVGNTAMLQLNLSNVPNTNSVWWNNTTPSAEVFTVGTNQFVNENTDNYIAYLFASVPGICSIGTYTGTGDAQWIDCGFGASAPRFVLIKSTSVAGDWYYWDSLRGLVSGNSPYLLLNTTDAQVTNTNWISPSDGKGKTGGFLLNSSSSSQIYKDGVEYIYMAIA